MLSAAARFPLNIILAIGRIGARPDDSDTARLQKTIQLNAIVLGGIPAQLAIGGLSLVFNELPAALSTFAFAAVSLLGVVHFAVTRRHFALFKFYQLAIPLVSPFVATLLLGGIANAGYSILWGFVAPVLALLLYTPRQATGWLMAFIGCVVAAALAQPLLRTGNNLPSEVIAVVSTINFVGITGIVFASLIFFVVQRDLAFKALNIERDKAENLLLNILPPEIAAVLKDRNGVIAEQYPGASVLFADVVDFTPLSASMKPVELVNLLNEVFTGFDALVDRFELEKIKTIGDCYMAAAGVPRQRPDHAEALVRLALEMRAQVASHTFQGHRLRFRVGINSGPIVAGVIGRKKFIYDLWGDAVNTASRMESHGKADAIQITRATYEAIRDAFECEPQGTIAVKGKGPMEIWHVVGAKDVSRPPPPNGATPK